MKNKMMLLLAAGCALFSVSGCASEKTADTAAADGNLPLSAAIEDQGWRDSEGGENLREIFYAGGCFWGVESYFSQVPGVHDVTVGYANGTTEKPSYEDVCSQTTGHAETVHVIYDPDEVSLRDLTEHFFMIINPLTADRQGFDVGSQYRSGIYYTDEADVATLQSVMEEVQKKYSSPIVTELLPLSSYYLAEEYHQDYLVKNPDGYCHVDFSSLSDFERLIDSSAYSKPSDEEIQEMVTEEQYKIIRYGDTEPAFTGEYDNFYEPGIYVDIVTGEPLFLSSDKYDAGCGWPSFSRPIAPEVVVERTDSDGTGRTEVRSRVGDIHLGHVFNDGREEQGGVRYCINSASLRFIPYANMEEEGYGDLMGLVADASQDAVSLNPDGTKTVASIGDNRITYGMVYAEVLQRKNDLEYRALNEYDREWPPEAWLEPLNEEETIADNLFGKVKDEMLGRLAAASCEDSASLSEKEEEQVLSAARRDYAAMTRDELSASGLTLEDYTLSLRFEKMYEKVKEQGDTEVKKLEEQIKNAEVDTAVLDSIKKSVFGIK